MYKKLAVTLVTAFAISGVACGSAFAEEYGGPTWAINEAAVKENVIIKDKNVTNLRLEDTKEGSIECKVSGEGKVGAEGKGEITSQLASECVSLKTCETGTATAKAVHLPWKTQLTGEEEIPIRDNLESGEGGSPGWEIECKVFGVKIKDECTGLTSAGIENVTGGVDLSFDSKSARAHCSLGGSETGVLAGTELGESPGSGKLTAADLVMHSLVVAVGGPAGATGVGTKICNLTATGQWCEIKLDNTSGSTVKITEKEINGPGGRYSLLVQECKKNVVLGTLVECIDKIELKATWATGWTNVWVVKVENSFSDRGTATVTLKT
jgi:hypothetical protein